MRDADVVVLVLGNDMAARTRTLHSLTLQTASVQVLAHGQSLLDARAPITVFVQAGCEFEATACERMAWLLRSTPSLEWVTGGSLEVPEPPSVVDAVMALSAFRTSALRQALGDARCRQAAHDGTATPGVSLQAVVALHRHGARGVCVGQPPLVRQVVTAEWQRACQQAQATLDVLGVDLASEVDVRGTRPDTVPLQRLDQALWPAYTPAPGSGARTTHRILLMVQGFPMGGYTAFNADLVPRLVARGHHVTTVCTEWWRANWRMSHVRRVAPDIHHVQSSSALAAIPAYIAQLIVSRDIDVVLLSHSFLSYRLLPLLKLAFPQVAFVDYVHTEWFEERMYGSYATMSARYGAQLDAQIASSHALAASLVQQGAEGARTHVAHIGIDTSWWSAQGIDRAGVRAAFGASPDTTVLLFAGRVSPEKRPLLVVDALDALRAEGRDVRLVVAGDGPMLQSMNEALELRGLADYASLLGEVDEDTLRQVYAASDIYFAPSEIEGIARTLYEAMAMGCVPVVSDVGGQRELVTAACGSLVDPGQHDVSPYLPALRRWCEPAARAVAAKVARDHIVANFDSTRTVEAMERAIRAAAVMAERRPAAAPMFGPNVPLAEDIAVMGLEIMRRHALAAT
jgi:glycosyltransferase involved in cell wall biosynthesis